MVRMRSASTSAEAEASLEEARVWLREHPGDDQVAAAMQRLEEKQERLENPERTLNWASAVVFVVSALAVWGPRYILSGSWTLSVLAGVVLGVEISWWTWEITLAFMERTRRNRSGG
jgi:hypothetical protein